MEGIRKQTTVRLPSKDTLAALEECRSGVELEELTPDQIEHFEEYVASL